MALARGPGRTVPRGADRDADRRAAGHRAGDATRVSHLEGCGTLHFTLGLTPT
jgi:hypothetical protein